MGVEGLDESCLCEACVGEEPSAPIAGGNPQMVFDAQQGYWKFGSPYTCVNTVIATPEIIKLYSIQEYSSIFPDFSEEDIVTTSGDITNIDVFLHLKRIVTGSKVPNGVYSIDTIPTGIVLRPVTISLDTYVSMPHSVESLPADMELFFNKRKVYKELGLRHKRGALVYGPHGNGKTFRILKCAQEFAKQFECIVFTLSSTIRTLDFLTYLTPVVQGRNTVIIMEELTERLNGLTGDFSTTLRFLDGDTSWSNTYIIATTNYPERLPANIVDRPGRFDILLEVNDPDENSRRKYLEHFIGDVSQELLKMTKGYSIAYLREMVIRAKLDEIPIELTVKSMKERKDRISSKFTAKVFGEYR